MAKTKADLIDEVAARTKLPSVRSELLVSRVFDCMVEAFHRGEGVVGLIRSRRQVVCVAC